MKNRVTAVILSGDGINCEHESAAAAREAGFDAQIVHVNDFTADGGKVLAAAKLLVLPGGFSFGDELGSGKILALKLRHRLGDRLEKFIARRGAVFGICNGFQVLTRLGVFGRGVVLAHNAQGEFLDRWVGLEITGSSIFTDTLRAKGIRRLELPIRHGEGRLVATQELKASVALRYEEDVNGSLDQIAALSAFDGRVLGMMPHPEAFWTEELCPWDGARLPLGVEMFRSAYETLAKE